MIRGKGKVEGEKKPPVWRNRSNRGLDNDINKLFESVSLRTSKSLDLTDSWRNASKKPMRANGSHSPGIGFSDPVSLKQALRGLCISQAAEMATAKRLSMPASPRISDLYRSVVVQTQPSGDSSNVDNKSLFPSVVKITDPPKQDEDSVKSSRKLRRKSRLQTVVKGNKVGNSVRVKPVRKKRNLIIAKSKKVADGTSKALICERCQCSLRDATSSAIKLDQIPIDCIAKGDISQSSQSSIGYFSSCSGGNESSLSGSTCSSRPHMSKDSRWEAIRQIRNQFGFIGLCHFSLVKKLGSGDIGTVYLAELTGTNCAFAIKVMDNEFLSRRRKMPRAHTEREILRLLDHPFLPTLYGQFTSDNLSCLVMEFCPGGDLHVLRQKQPGRFFAEQAARFYVAEVLLALEYLHMLGIVYRDLKPENILVREDGHIMLTDFDLSLRCSVSPTLVEAVEPPRVSGPCAGSNCIDPFCAGPSCKMSCFLPGRKATGEDTAALPQLVVEPTEARSNSFVGTHEYLAPEIIKGEGHGSAVDWWTLGVFLYELVYGKTPFKGRGNEETMTNVLVQNLTFPETPMVSFQGRDLMRSLLVKEPENRLGTETGASEIKRHRFFEGLNWALIRCAVPPQVPCQGQGETAVEFNGHGENLDLELF